MWKTRLIICKGTIVKANETHNDVNTLVKLDEYQKLKFVYGNDEHKQEKVAEFATIIRD